MFAGGQVADGCGSFGWFLAQGDFGVVFPIGYLVGKLARTSATFLGQLQIAYHIYENVHSYRYSARYKQVKLFANLLKCPYFINQS